MWYANSLEYDISYILQQVIPSIECGYPYSFDVCQVGLDEFGNETELPLPNEIGFVYNPSTAFVGFNIEKCNPIGVDSPVDPECNNGMQPQELTWPLRMKISLVQPTGDSFGTVDFLGRINDPCLVDTVSMVNLMATPIDYTLQFVPYEATYEVRVS